MRVVDFNHAEHIQSEAIRQCLDFASKNDLEAIPIGKYEIAGEQIYAVVTEYQTTPAEERQWEAHREYIDIQLIIRGEEAVEVTPLSKMQCGEYIEHLDFQQCDGPAEEKVPLQLGKGLLLFPEDAHKPGVEHGGSQLIKKVIFKVHCTCLI